MQIKQNVPDNLIEKRTSFRVLVARTVGPPNGEAAEARPPNMQTLLPCELDLDARFRVQTAIKVGIARSFRAAGQPSNLSGIQHRRPPSPLCAQRANVPDCNYNPGRHDCDPPAMQLALRPSGSVKRRQKGPSAFPSRVGKDLRLTVQTSHCASGAEEIRLPPTELAFDALPFKSLFVEPRVICQWLCISQSRNASLA